MAPAIVEAIPLIVAGGLAAAALAAARRARPARVALVIGPDGKVREVAVDDETLDRATRPRTPSE